MSVETQSEHLTPVSLSNEDIAEMSLANALRRVVDDLFTDQAVAEPMQANADNPAVQRLVEVWKQGLVRQLSETVQGSVENVVGILKLMQSGASPPVTDSERLEWEQIAWWYESFVVSSICREDLRQFLTNEEITALDDGDMDDIADRMSDAHRDSGGYWEALEIMTRFVIEKKQADEAVVPAGERDTQPENAQPST